VTFTPVGFLVGSLVPNGLIISRRTDAAIDKVT